MGLLRPTFVTVVSAALLAGVLSAPPTSAGAQPPHRALKGGDHFPASVDTEVPPGGYSTITSPTIPKDAKTLKVKLEVQDDATKAEAKAFDSLSSTLGKLTKGQRLLACVLIYNDAVRFSKAEDHYGKQIFLEAEADLFAFVVLVACIQVAGLLTSDAAADGASTPRTSPRAKMRKCIQDKPGAPGTVEKLDDGWKLTVDGTLEERRNKLKVGCRTKSGKTVLTVRAAKKGTPLRKVLGKQPRLALVSPADAEASAPTTVTFSLP
jgi:hypothetical protein